VKNPDAFVHFIEF